MRTVALAAAGWLALGSGGCAAARPGAGDRLSDRAARARSGDVSIVPDLIESLDSTDPGERAFAHATILDVLGARGRRVDPVGYRPWAPRQERLERIEEIRAFWRRWKLELERGSAPPEAGLEPRPRAR